MERRDQVLIPLSISEIKELIQALKEQVDIKSSVKSHLLDKLYHHEEWFTTLKQITNISPR